MATSSNKKKLIIGISLVLGGLIIYGIIKAIKRAKSRKECEQKGGKWDKKTKTCIINTPKPLKDVIAKVYSNLTFVTNSSTIKSSSFPFLKEMATYLKANPEVSLKITGHTDNVGNDAYNLDLSKKRADSVQNYLVGEGVGEIALATDGKGESEPIADNNTAEGRALNRRVVFEVTKVEEEPQAQPQV
jgi:outer membrane protein OmpA-like peptidoglycan-associated protein